MYFIETNQVELSLFAAFVYAARYASKESKIFFIQYKVYNDEWPKTVTMKHDTTLQG